MCRQLQKILVALTVIFATQAALPLHDELAPNTLTLGQCGEHLHGLVSQLQDQAQRRGNAILVEWNTDGSVVLRYPHFAQRMFCENGVLLVDYPSPPAIAP